MLAEVGYHSVLNRNCQSEKSSFTSTGAASRSTKKKIAATNTIALTPREAHERLERALALDGPGGPARAHDRGCRRRRVGAHAWVLDRGVTEVGLVSERRPQGLRRWSGDSGT